MDKNLYTDTMDSIRISDEAVEKAIKNIKQPDAVGKVIEMKNKKHRFVKPIGAVAAALALIVGAGAIFNLGSMPEQGAANSFFITANAATTDGEPAEITEEFTTIGTVTPYVVSYGSTSLILNELTVNADLNLSCSGTNIETITYKVTNGDSDGAVCLFDYNTKVVDYGKRNEWFHGGKSSLMINNVYGNYLYYDYATFNYDNQLIPDDNARIAVYYEPASIEEATEMQSFLDEVNGISHKSLDMNLKDVKERIKEFYQIVFRNTEVVVTAAYKDGSIESKTLKLGIDSIIIYDEDENEVTDETLRYKEFYDYELNMSAKLV